MNATTVTLSCVLYFAGELIQCATTVLTQSNYELVLTTFFLCNSTASIYLDLHHSVWNGPDGRLIWNYATCISYKITNHVSFYKQLNASTV